MSVITTAEIMMFGYIQYFHFRVIIGGLLRKTAQESALPNAYTYISSEEYLLEVLNNMPIQTVTFIPQSHAHSIRGCARHVHQARSVTSRNGGITSQRNGTRPLPQVKSYVCIVPTRTPILNLPTYYGVHTYVFIYGQKAATCVLEDW